MSLSTQILLCYVNHIKAAEASGNDKTDDCPWNEFILQISEQMIADKLSIDGKNKTNVLGA